MNLMLCGKVPDEFGDGWNRISASIEPEKLVEIAVDVWTRGGMSEEVEISRALFDACLPKAFANLRPKQVYVTPAGVNWLVIRWCDQQSCEPVVAGMVFACRGDETTDFHYYPVPAAFHIDPVTGSLTTEFNGEKLRFPAWTGDWPMQLAYPDKYVALGLLESLLTPVDENPLTMLAASNHQPCKGAAKQVISKLRKIRDLLNAKTI